VVANLRIKLASAALIAAASLAATAAPAGALIVPQQGMAGIKLGMDKSAVRDKLGKPRKVVTGTNDFGTYTQYRFKHKVTVLFQGGSTVTSIRTASGAERTKEGIGVGSNEQAIKDKFPHVKCRTLVKSRSCYLGELSPGKRVTNFQLRQGSVRWVSIGFVSD
jgi:hypothetical protein